MTPIRELLNRIRWDPAFGRGKFELGCFDPLENRVIVVLFRELNFPEDDPQAFRLADTEGRIHRVLFHPKPPGHLRRQTAANHPMMCSGGSIARIG
ncbi:MAG: DUF504 domain-containing protein [Limisphaerales bacterium]